MSKSTGSYYTPRKLSAFIWEHALKNIQRHPQIRILEPGCGDGIFLEIASKTERNETFLVDAVEINQEAIAQAREVITQKNGHFQVNFINDDFLNTELPLKYDLIIGNPPYVGRNLLSEEQRELCQQIHIKGGLDGKNIRNIWSAFVVKATLSLNSTGMLALVLPGNLLQVSYAEKIQSFLEEHFKAIEILTFRELVFPALGQDVVIIFAYKASPFSGIRYTQVRDIDSLDTPVIFSHRVSNSSNSRIKWSNFILNDSDLKFLSNLAQKLGKVSDYCTSIPGIVTAANRFFIVNKKTVDEYSLEPYCEPILQKAEFVDKAVSIDESSFEELKKANKPCFFINLGDIDKKSLPLPVQNYLQQGIEQQIHKRYKCKRRKPWYNIPSVWIPEGVIFKRCHLYPKLLKNEAQALFTDSAYRIRPREGFDINSFIYSFYNSLTLVFCELNGRFYGEGVLELTPQEFRDLPIPYKSISEEGFLDFKKAFAKNGSIEQVLQQNDVCLLVDLGFDSLSLKRLEKIRQKLLVRRLKNKANGRNR